jgi:glycosyltransferase involved in cell wall biosynthesis
MSPCFSIIVPVYNTEPYLRECLDSVLSQTFANWECICVDDGSTDGSGAILDEYSNKDPRFRVIHQKNTGAWSARNKALDLSRGEWALFADGDDLIHPEALTMVYGWERNNKADLVVLRQLHFRDGERVNWGMFSEDATVFNLQNEVLPDLFNAAYLIGGICVKLSCIPKLRFPCRRLGEDRVFVMNCLCLVDTVVVSKDPFGGYRQHPKSVSHATWDLDRLSEEMDYRMDILSFVSTCSKFFPVEQAWWFQGYIVRDFFNRIRELPRGIQRIAFGDWLKMSTPLCKRRNLPRSVCIRLCICNLLYRFGHTNIKFVRQLFLALSYLSSIFLFGFLPRARDAVVSRLRK